MTFPHTCALALVGWYLMYPPYSPPTGLDISAPLSQWEQRASFDSAAKCEKFLAGLTWPFDRPGKRQDEPEALRYAKCIATDDPRLKDKP